MGDYNKKLLDHAKQSATDKLKTASKGAIPKKQNQLVISLVINPSYNYTNLKTVSYI